MQGNDLSNEPTRRYWVLSEVVLLEQEIESEKRWFRTKTRVLQIPDPAALSELWRFSVAHGVRMELVFAGEAASDAVPVWDALDKMSNPFSDWLGFESISAVAKAIPYRPDLMGVIDVPGRSAVYGGKGLTLGSLR